MRCVTWQEPAEQLYYILYSNVRKLASAREMSGFSITSNNTFGQAPTCNSDRPRLLLTYHPSKICVQLNLERAFAIISSKQEGIEENHRDSIVTPPRGPWA